MRLNELFLKPVDRAIEGVIKADADTDLKLEFEEYVLTNEVAKRLERFLEAYNNYEGANGVWISGFFGSGKSHLLKILSYLLENNEIAGSKALDLFLPKCTDNTILAADLKKAVALPSESILFNIDQKADVISKTQLDALVAVFVKVFDEHCGYYGKQAYIAQFERELDLDGQLDAFKKEFEAIAGKDWLEYGRPRVTRVSGQIDEAFNKVTGQSQSGIIDKYRSDYSLSIEDFAEQVKSYVATKPANFRLNFYVDEVGQYIADNVKLMTNLQTVAESLATKCDGQAWVIVTAQEDMTTVVGELGQQQSNDFTKIQARFSNRMKLTSQDVAEVIQKRLLTKNETGINLLEDVHHEHSGNFGTLFDFADGAKTYRNFEGRDHFIHSYPFIPYQFGLFQGAIQSLSQHNAFEGKHSSVGERSMLGVFQQVAIQIGDHEPGQLATFDLMYEGIRTTLKSGIQRAIHQAENNLKSPFAIRLLKALFLVKYVKDYRSTKRNLCVLMLDRLDQDIRELRDSVEEALNLLEQQTYIQRNGDTYEYLTDEEKDVEEEIKNTDVEDADVASELSKMVFDGVIKSNKIRYDDAGMDYPYTRRLDERLLGKEHELSIRVITPFHEHAGNEGTLQMQNMGKDELMVVMPQDARLMGDLLMFKKTEKYIRQNMATTQQESVQRILSDKGYQNQERERELKNRVRDLLGQSKLFVSGGNLEISSQEPQTRIIQGFHDLVSRIYPNLKMLRGVKYSENDLEKILRESPGSLFGTDATVLSEPEQEVLSLITRNSTTGVRTTLKSLLEDFERKPYGWPYAAILCFVTGLCARGKVVVKSDSNPLEDTDLLNALRNTHGQGNLILEPQVQFTTAQVADLKSFYNDFFNMPPSANEAKALGQETGDALKDYQNEVKLWAQQCRDMPFVGKIEEAAGTLAESTGKSYTFYLTEFKAHSEELLDLSESLLEPIRRFLAGPQKDIFDEASRFLRDQEPNSDYLKGPDWDKLESIIQDPNCFRGNRMQEAKTLVDSLKKAAEEALAEAVSEARTKIDVLRERLKSDQAFDGLDGEVKVQFLEQFDRAENGLSGNTIVPVIKDEVSRFESVAYPKILEEVGKLASGTESKIEIVRGQSLAVHYSKPLLDSEEDVDTYLQALRDALVTAIKDGKKIQI